MTKRGLFVGRFQPFHLGHLDMVKYALTEVDELIIVIGSAQDSHTQMNPFTAGERYQMVDKGVEGVDVYISKAKRMPDTPKHLDYFILLKKPIYIIPVPDSPSNVSWVTTIESYVPTFDVVYTNEPLSTRLFKEAGYEVHGHIMRDRKTFSGTNIRRLMIKVLTQYSGIGDYWEEYVPKETANFIKEKHLIERLVDLNKSDKE